MTFLKKLVLATHNPGKLRELKAIVPPRVHLKNISDFSSVSPEENGENFYENAALKAKSCFKLTKLPSLADDSGLCIKALQGAPGLHSKQFIEDHGGPAQTFKFLADNQAIKEDPEAYCICVLALAFSKNDIRFYEGRCLGKLSFPARGNGGHGYDPIFIPKGSDLTFAQMTVSEKALLSHRGQALNAFIKDCF